ncbi:MAG: carboxypeptidase-like regulatory domain-containing protein [Terracidiphilus sp.]
MRFSRLLQVASLSVSLLLFAGFIETTSAPSLYAQSNISGDISGTVTDASGAAMPDAQVTVTSLEKGQAKTVLTDHVGDYRVPLLSPGRYQVKATAKGFETSTVQVTVSAGSITPVNIALTIGQASTTIEVNSGEIAVLHTDDAQISTSFDLNQLQNLPNPGGDLTFAAQTTPGAIMNTQGGYGNFAVDGLPATSNTFTMNGGYEGDPYLNLNNSGATNLLLGQNDVDTVTVTTNGYDAAFGGLGGAQVNQVSRSGSNQWHGNLDYLWNGRVMNANSWFNKYYNSPRNFDNANQWAAAIGGPLKKDKIFGFIDNEGLRVIIPLIGAVYAPSPNWQAAILGPAGSASAAYAPYGNLADNGNSDEAPMYQTIFKYYNNARNFAAGSQDPNDPDTWIFNGQATNFATEWLINSRVDFNLSQSDHMYIHSKVDHGIQPTQTSFLDPVFDAASPQPSYEGQLSETHTFTPYLTNQFLFAASYYRAIFTNTHGSTLGASNVPYTLIPEGFATGSGDWDLSVNASDWVGGVNYAFPQGRNVTGYQFSDDLTWVKGKNTWKFGYAFRRDDITDYTPSEHQVAFGGGENFVYDQGDFAAGLSDIWQERFPQRLTAPIAMYVEGFYAQDQYKPLPNLTITLGLRLEHDSNPLCRTNCVSNLSQDFSQLPTGRDTPYNKLFASGRTQGLFEEQILGWQPRFGFSYLPFGPGSKTTIRGGFGLFNDYFPAQIMGDLISNVPNVNRFTVYGAAYGTPIAMDPSRADSGHAIAVTSNNALKALFPLGGYYRNAAGTCPDPLSIYCATGGVFSRPTVFGAAHKIDLPSYDEWSFAIENQILKNTVLAVQYVGNRSYHQPVTYMPNAYWAPNGGPGSNASLPAARPNAALGSTTEVYSGSWSNFNGLQGTLTSRLNWLTMQLNYTYGHALDTTSNGGFNAFGVNSGGQINPYDLKQNYGNADYDVRHYISANYSIRVPYWGGPHVLADGWQLAGTVFHNTGYPFSVTDDTAQVAYGNAPLAQQIDNSFNHHCGGKSHVDTPCSFASHFTNSTDYGQQRRNQLFGPNYTDFDMDLSKSFRVVPKRESAKLKVAVQFFNTFNHANFQIPLNDVNSSGLGTIYSAASTPTSVLGAFLGGDASPRLIQLKGSFVF